MQKEKRGFTLIELLVVVLIIGILASVALPQYQVAVTKTRFTQMQALTNAYMTAIDSYYLTNGTWPRYWRDMDFEPPAHCKTEDDSRSEGYMGCGEIQIDLNTNNLYAMIPTQKIAYKRYFSFDKTHPNERQCIARTDNNTAKQTCKSLGGTESNIHDDHSFCLGGHPCTVYLLN